MGNGKAAKRVNKPHIGGGGRKQYTPHVAMTEEFEARAANRSTFRRPAGGGFHIVREGRHHDR